MTRAVFLMKERSGSRCRVSGVGTQMMMTSQAASSAKSALARNRPLGDAAARASDGTASMYELPPFSLTIFSGSMSKPVTGKPPRAIETANGSPT